MTGTVLPIDIRKRLEQLNSKAYYLLIALSLIYKASAVSYLLKWALALTAIVAVLPVQDYVNSTFLLRRIRDSKALLLLAALTFTLIWICAATKSYEQNTIQAKEQNELPSASSATDSLERKITEDQKSNRNSPYGERIYEVKLKDVPPDYWMRAYVIVNGFIALFALGTLWFVRRQRDVMEGQLKAMQDQITEMKIAREQTSEQLKSAGRQTDKLISNGISVDRADKRSNCCPSQCPSRQRHSRGDASLGTARSESMALHC